MAVVGSRVTVSTTATLLATDVDSGSVVVRNRDASAAIDIGGSAVTSGTGYQLDAGESVFVDISQGESLYGIAASGTVAVHVLRVGA